VPRSSLLIQHQEYKTGHTPATFIPVNSRTCKQVETCIRAGKYCKPAQFSDVAHARCSRDLSMKNGESRLWNTYLIRAPAIAQAVSSRLPTAESRVRAKVRSCGICGGQSGTGVGLSEYFDFPCQFSFHRLLHTHHLSTEAGTIEQIMADVPSGLSLTPP
jgi:hypothetical protein